MSNRINNSYNMKLIRKAMIDFNLDNIEQLADFLYISETSLRARLNGKTMVCKSDLEFMEHKLNITFKWDEIKHERGNYYRFYDRIKSELENE